MPMTVEIAPSLFHPLSRALSLAFKLARVSQALLGLDTESNTSAVSSSATLFLANI